MSDRDRIVELEAAMKDVIIRLEELERGQKEAEKVSCDYCHTRIPEDEAISAYGGNKLFCSDSIKCILEMPWNLRKKKGDGRTC